MKSGSAWEIKGGFELRKQFSRNKFSHQPVEIVSLLQPIKTQSYLYIFLSRDGYKFPFECNERNSLASLE